MIKDTIVNTTLTPLDNRDIADAILGKVVEPQTRWSPGSLISSLFGESSSKQLVLMTNTQIQAFTYAGVLDLGFLDDLAESPGNIGSYEFFANASESRSKTLNVGSGETVSIDLLDNLDAPITEPLYRGILLPALPTYTILSLVNKLEALLVADGSFYVIVISQENDGEVRVYAYGTSAQADAAVAAAAATMDTDGFEMNVAFITTPGSSSGSDVPSFGWE